MKLKTHHIKGVLILSVLLLTSSCSTKKKSWVNRQYHNTTAKFNGYFNGNESIKLGVKKLHASHIDDYTAILPVFPTGDLKKSKKSHSYMDKAIKKGSIVIQRHSMKIKGKEYCKWIDDNYLMVGKSYFYKGEFDEAIKTFSYIKNEYEKNEIVYYAAMWLVRGYIEKGDYSSAESELEELLKNKKFPQKLEKELTVITADFYVQKGDYPQATKELTQATELIKRKRKKARFYYILAQIYQQDKNHTQAQKYYELVLKSNPHYEMTFNAKMNLARSLASGGKDAQKMKENLFKMTKDDKNKEYLDQIYFTLAEMDITINDTASAIKNYTLSAVNSIKNNPQKAISFLEIGKIDFERALYKSAKVHYDSTLFYMDSDFRMFEKANERHEILSDLIENLHVIELQDSLQVLAKLPKSEQIQMINQIIQTELEREREEMENDRLRRQMSYESGKSGGRGEQFGNNTSGGKWYFYNPATLSFGMSEFRKKWGKRKLEDDWRRKDKNISNSFEVDSIAADSIATETKNKKDPNYYLKQLPSSEEDFLLSDAKIKEALYQVGIIYKEQLQEFTRSTSAFSSLYNRFPSDEQFAPLSCYSIYVNHTDLNNKLEAQNSKQLLLKRFPKSIYAQILTNPDFKLETTNKLAKEELDYRSVFANYSLEEYQQVIDKTTVILENDYQSKYLFLRALAFLNKDEFDKGTEILNKLISLDADEKTVKEAQYILDALNDPSKMEKANELAIAGSPYLYRSDLPQMIIVILPKEEVDITYLKTLISDYHSQYFENEVFDISALLLGMDKHLLMIKTFDNTSDVMVYHEMFVLEESILKELNKSEHKVMAISFENFQEFYKNKDEDGYHNFFNKNYLTIE
ncbi:tetratricopeptide repeat protein [Flavobacteriales bacterium]|nr:tetratricopeptide repeat protein [Flavobacteriales bacterium]